jgi:hypothetical protein
MKAFAPAENERHTSANLLNVELLPLSGVQTEGIHPMPLSAVSGADPIDTSPASRPCWNGRRCPAHSPLSKSFDCRPIQRFADCRMCAVPPGAFERAGTESVTDRAYPRGDPFLNFRPLMINETGSEAFEVLLGVRHNRCAHPLAVARRL